MAHNLLFKAIKQEDFEISPVGDDFLVEGYASIFGNVDDGGDKVMQGAFRKTLQEMGDRVAMCYQHDLWNPIGKITKCNEDQKGLYFKARISDAEPGIKTKIREKILKEMSIGYQTMNSHKEVDDGIDVNCLDELKLYEMSLVTLAMNSQAFVNQTMSMVKSYFGINSIDEEFDRLIHNERDQRKKFDLLKLKNIALSLMPEPDDPLKGKNIVLHSEEFSESLLKLSQLF